MPRATGSLGQRATNKIGVYRLPKKLDEEVARLQLDRIGVKADEADEKTSRLPRRAARRPIQAEHYRY